MNYQNYSLNMWGVIPPQADVWMISKASPEERVAKQAFDLFCEEEDEHFGNYASAALHMHGFDDLHHFRLEKDEPISLCHLILNGCENTFFEACMEDDRDLEPSLKRLGTLACESDFEDGMETSFSLAIVDLVRAHGGDAVNALERWINTKASNTEAAAEALRWIGRVDDSPTHEYRRWLLERSLASGIARIRDGAVIGLSSLNDPKAIPALKAAFRFESNNELKVDIGDLIQEFEHALEQKHRLAYERKPVSMEEVNDWAEEQVWLN
ncbi:MAG: HEAT repeat domain-containing protein [Candidatus Obscuribacterales bacterium]|nr:HEAT repeat domain-containing protein [Candidatus Obscuribacterales bacterium]